MRRNRLQLTTRKVERREGAPVKRPRLREMEGHEEMERGRLPPAVVVV